ncbi:hypothetical protein RJT34_24197 [Clitoria ternatea]|uniref:Uncharacterized protein n=1 Tax=Clitoria ternatea TaxID=43366 RepID=A0AAN9FQA9_CLITE
MLIPLISGGSPTTVPHLRRLSVPQQATLAQNSDGRKYCEYDSDIATGLASRAFLLHRLTKSIIFLFVTFTLHLLLASSALSSSSCRALFRELLKQSSMFFFRISRL